MAFENIGLGGILSFDADRAVTQMSRASAAFSTLEKNFGSARSSIAQLSNSLQGLNFLSIGLGAAGIAGFGAIATSAISAKAEFESMQTQLATSFNVLAGGGKMKEGLALAKEEMKAIERLAVQAPGGAQDLLQIYKQIVGPMSVQGQSLEQVREMTFGASIAAKGLGISFDEMGFGLSKLVAGTVQSDDRIFKMSKSMGLIKMDAAEWNALTPVERQKQLNSIMGKYREAGDAVGATWEATLSTLGDIMTVMKRAFIGPMFDALKEKISNFNDQFLKSQARFESMGEAIGAALMPAFEFMFEILGEIVERGKQFVGWLMKAKEAIDELRYSISPEMSQKIGDMGVAAGALAVGVATVLPMLGLMTTFLGPVQHLFGSIFGVAKGLLLTIKALPTLLAYMIPALTPILFILGAVGLAFLAFRRDGEGIVDTFMRIFEVLKSAWEGFTSGFLQGIDGIVEPLMMAWNNIRDSFTFLVDYLADTWDIAGGDAQGFGYTIGSVFALIARGIATAMEFAGEYIATFITSIVLMIHWFKVLGQRIGEVFGMVFLTVKNQFSFLFNIITAPIRNILDFVAEAIRTIATTSVGRKALEAVGINPAEAIKSADALKAETSAGALSRMQYAYVPGFEEIESPEDEVARKRVARALKEKDAAPMKFDPMDITVKDQREVSVKMNLNVDGKTLSSAQARQQLELSERAGAQNKPWQRRNAVTRATPLK